MNIYARFFDSDVLVSTLDELVSFLSTFPDITLTPELVKDLRDYIDGDTLYPRRCKVRPKVYFILIKTTARTMEEFKNNRKGERFRMPAPMAVRDERLNQISQIRPGWYEARIVFKRVLPIGHTGKMQYRDTEFAAYVKAQNAQEAYNRLVFHLRSRQDIDPRSQFPSSRGSNFQFSYLGTDCPVKAGKLSQTPT